MAWTVWWVLTRRDDYPPDAMDSKESLTCMLLAEVDGNRTSFPWSRYVSARVAKSGNNQLRPHIRLGSVLSDVAQFCPVLNFL